jgi:hypothetical protein
MKKPTLVLVPSPPKAPPGEPQWIPFHGELEPIDPTKGLVLTERKAPYLTCIRTSYSVAARPGSSTEK